MDITQNELKVMKAKQLRRIVREAIQEILKEAEISPQEKAAKDAELNAINKQIQALQAKKTDLASGRTSVVSENEIDEMARTAKGFELADPEMDTSSYTNKRVSGISLADIINFFRENPGADKKSLQTQFNFARPQIANAVVNALLDAGVLVKLGAGGEVEATPEPGEEIPTQATEPEDLFMGSSENPLSIYFDNEPNDDGSEDFTDSTEPETGEIEKAEPINISTTKGKAAEFTLDKDRLISSIINNYAIFKSKFKSSGEIGGIAKGDINKSMQTSKAFAETKFPQQLKQLVDDIKQEDLDVQKAILDLLTIKFASVKYPSLAKTIAKELNLDIKIPIIKPSVEEPEESEEEETTIKEGLDEYDIQKLQYYAGIRK